MIQAGQVPRVASPTTPDACELSRALACTRKWLVTGVAGFVGSHLLERLLATGQQVRGLDSFVTGSMKNLAEVRARVGARAWQNFELMRADIRCPQSCMRAVQGVDLVLHQAALGSVPRSLNQPTQTYEVNVEGTRHIFSAASSFGLRVVYASSSSVYGDTLRLPNRVGSEGRCLSPYAQSKWQNEEDAQRYCAEADLDPIGLRYFNVFGPRQRATGAYLTVWPTWLDSLAQKKAPLIYGDGTVSRDYCPVQNVVQANLRAALLAKQSPAIYNVGLGETRSLLQLFDAMKAAFIELGLNLDDVAPRFAPGRKGDVQHTRACLSRIRHALGYRIEQDFDRACRELVQMHLVGRRPYTRYPAAEPPRQSGDAGIAPPFCAHSLGVCGTMDRA